MARTAARLLLGAFLLLAGVAHLVAPEPFLAQVPPFLPAPGAVVLVSGLVEIAAGGAVLLAPARLRPRVGLAVAALFVVVFPGNVSQYLTATPAFGLDTDGARAVRLLFQPVLLAWALWSCAAWGPLLAALRRRSRRA
ncbi:DoxX family protein [Pseudonocardia spirodelae]|uniref:DoxX family membrane protein n=1 Tax=Pseudonocardia spirodelae TaxID=3133431 RepID=A0ABU8T7X5_9PSEU